MPPFQPEDGWIYVLDVDDNIIYSGQPPDAMWDCHVCAYELERDQPNRDEGPGYPFRVV